jgi:hypothetical protein
MLAQCRTARLPAIIGEAGSETLERHIKAYDKMLLGMPAAMNMKGDQVRPHLIRKHMLAVSAGTNIMFTRPTLAVMRSMAPDMCHAQRGIPRWFTSKTLAFQLQCDPQFMYMWACLWKDALEHPGAREAVFADTAGIKTTLAMYMAHHPYPPSPYVLMAEHLRIPNDSLDDEAANSDAPPADSASTSAAKPKAVLARERARGMAKSKARGKDKADSKVKGKVKARRRVTAVQDRVRGVGATNSLVRGHGHHARQQSSNCRWRPQFVRQSPHLQRTSYMLCDGTLCI